MTLRLSFGHRDQSGLRYYAPEMPVGRLLSRMFQPPERLLKASVVSGAFMFEWWVTRKGVALSHDSIDYVSAGMNLLKGRGLRTFAGNQLTLFPPGLSLIYAIGQLFGLSVQLTARILNVASIAGMTSIGMSIVKRSAGGIVQEILVGGVIAVGACNAFVSTYVWTEPSFNCLVLLSFLMYFRYSAQPKRMSTLVGLAAVTSACFMIRYAGLVLVPVFVISDALASRRKGVNGNWRSSLRLCCTMLIVPTAWTLGNLSTGHSPFGARPPSIQSLSFTVDSYFHQLISLYSGDQFAFGVRWWLVVGIVVTCACILLFGLWADSRESRWLVRTSPNRAAVMPLGLFVIMYSAYLVTSEMVTSIDPIDIRLMSPLFAPGVLFGVVALSSIRFSLNRKPSSVQSALVAVALVGLLGVQLNASLTYIPIGPREQIQSIRSATIDRVGARVPANVDFYTNVGYELWLLRPRNGILESPLKTWYRSDVRYPVTKQFIESVSCNSRLLVWSDSGPNWFYSPRELSRFVRVKLLRSYADGAVYRLSHLGGLSHCRL